MTDRIKSFSDATINNSGHVAFGALISNSAGSPIGRGVYIAHDGTITEVHRNNANTTASPILNQMGQVAFDTQDAVYRASISGVTNIATQGTVAPGGNGTFSTFSNVALNEPGLVAYHAVLENTAGGVNDNTAIYVSDGIDTVEVARAGNQFFGLGAIRDLQFDRLYGFNDFGQLAYHVSTTDSKALALWTPELSWRAGAVGSWSDASNWTLGLRPDMVHGVSISTSSNVVVDGPTGVSSFQKLTIGGGSGQSVLRVANGSDISTVDGTHVAQNGQLQFNAVTAVVRGDLVNEGNVEVTGSSQATFDGSIAQHGVLDISSGSSVIVTGAFSGESGFTGNGELIVAGELRPGNSAASVAFNGKLSLLSSTDTYIELGGIQDGMFDQLLVSGDLGIDGQLIVSLIDGFTLSGNQEFLIANSSGALSGQFIGLDEGGLVGVFAGHELFITYGMNDGHGVGLFTAVPEPNSTILFSLVGGIACLVMVRRRTPGVRPAA
ncbi:MAG: PEP-CTERM sorting domain-containing protein [Pirellulaceae bacterium]